MEHPLSNDMTGRAHLPTSDSLARLETLRWTITKTIGVGGTKRCDIDGPDIRRMDVVPAEVTDEMIERLDEAFALLGRARLAMDHLHRDGIGPGFLKVREDIARFLGMPAEPEGFPDVAAFSTREVRHGMIPGSHERMHGPECHCGQPWLWFDDRCSSEAPAESREGDRA